MEVRRLGLVPYRDAWLLQEACRTALGEGRGPEVLLVTEHPPVLTLGRSTRAGDQGLSREAWTARGVEVVAVDRGGRATWHGPGQVVMYPVLDLGRRGRDLRAYVGALEDAGAAAVRRFGIDAQPGRDPVGVFVGATKVASVGVSVRRWLAAHGLAVNVTNDLDAYRHFSPCGLEGVLVGRLADFAPVSSEQLREALVEELSRRLAL